jgi:hypothetical protein
MQHASIGELEEYSGAGELATDQFRYSMLLRDAEQDVLPWCRDHGAGALTYMSLEQGLLTGKVGMDRLFSPEASRSNEEWNPWYKRENRGKVLDMLGRWSDLLAKYDCSFAQLVLAWTAAQGGVTHVLAGFRDENQVRENAAAFLFGRSPGATTGSLPLNRRTFHRAIGTEHATIARLRPEQRSALLALVEELAGIGRHDFRFRVPATRTGYRRAQDYLRHFPSSFKEDG